VNGTTIPTPAAADGQPGTSLPFDLQGLLADLGMQGLEVRAGFTFVARTG